MQLCGNHDGPLFCHSDRTPVSWLKFDQLLCRFLKFCRLDASRYKGQSFRIGAATYAAQCNLSDLHIRALGRWSFKALKVTYAYHVNVGIHQNYISFAMLRLCLSEQS